MEFEIQGEGEPDAKVFIRLVGGEKWDGVVAYLESLAQAMTEES
jgi:hypothetical protein